VDPWLARPLAVAAAGLLLLAIARLIDPRLAGDAHTTGDPA
jgi:hypothetical protein